MGEFLLLLLALAVGGACRVLPAHLPYLFPFVFNAPVFLGCWLTALWYWRGMRRIVPERRPGRVRQGFFLAGLAGIYFVLQTHFEYVSQHMFFLNRVQAVTLGMAAPFCIAIGWMGEVLAAGAPGWVVNSAREAWARLRWLSHPVPATLIFLASTDVWLIPAVHFAAMLNPLLYAVMNISCLLGGLLFWLMVLDPRPKPEARFGYLVARRHRVPGDVSADRGEFHHRAQQPGFIPVLHVVRAAVSVDFRDVRPDAGGADPVDSTGDDEHRGADHRLEFIAPGRGRGG